MPDKEKKDEFVVTDRRRRYDDENDSPAESPKPSEPAQEPAEPQAQAPATPSSVPEPSQPAEPELPPGPSAEERERSNTAYRASADQMEADLRKQYGSQLSGVDFNVRFEDVLEPFYVTALMQLGGMGQEGQQQRRVDPLGARRTIDTLELLRDKMKGNLSQQETDLLETMLYQLRMAYMDVINALTRPPQGGGPAPIK